MIEFLNNKNRYDFIHQFQWINNKNKPIIKEIIIDNNNNNIIKNNKLIYVNYYGFLMLFNQKPFCKLTKKSYASFNVRPNMRLGNTISILSKNNLLLSNMIFYYFNTNFKYNLCKIDYNNKDNYYNINVNYGLKNVTGSLLLFNEFKNIGGCNIKFKFISPTKTIPFYYLPIK